MKNNRCKRSCKTFYTQVIVIIIVVITNLVDTSGLQADLNLIFHWALRNELSASHSRDISLSITTISVLSPLLVTFMYSHSHHHLSKANGMLGFLSGCLHDNGLSFNPEWARSGFFISPLVTMHLSVQYLHDSGTKEKSVRIEFAPSFVPDRNLHSSARSYREII